MSKAKIKKYTDAKRVVDENGDEHIIFVYGELTVDENLKGVAIHEVAFNRSNYTIRMIEGLPRIYKTGKAYGATRTLNFGWAICHPNDKFDMETAVNLCKKRFSNSGISTQDCRFLTDDMVKCILQNEIRYIEEVKLPEYINKKPEQRVLITAQKEKKPETVPYVKKSEDGVRTGYIVYSQNKKTRCVVFIYDDDKKTKKIVLSSLFLDSTTQQQLLKANTFGNCSTDEWEKVKEKVYNYFKIDIRYQDGEVKLYRNGKEIRGDVFYSDTFESLQ